LDAVEDGLISGGYDDIELPTGGFEFTIRVGIINQKGTAQFSGGSLKGMQTIRRNSNGNVTPLVSTLVGKMS
jgi:hypothetical protein